MDAGIKPDNAIPPVIPKRGEDRKRLIIAVMMAAVMFSFVPLCVRIFVVQPFRVPTNAMAPTIRGVTELVNGRTRVGDHIFVDKLAYRLRAPRRGEIVVFYAEGIERIPLSLQSKFFVKRLVGLPGERVSIWPPFLYINDQRVTEPRIFETIANREHGYAGFQLPDCVGSFKPLLCTESDSVQLGKDEYFVLGDNQAKSLDSRFWGPVPRSNIVGRATTIYWPLDRAGISLAE
jgi:signal peptidase I